MKGSLWSAGRIARPTGAAVALLLAIRVLGAQSAATSRRLSCASSLERGKDLLDRRQFRQAEELLVRAAGVCPSVAEIFDTLGLAYDFDGHPTEAQATYRRAISIDTRNAGFHNNLAASLLRSGNQAAAISEFRQALESDPANKTANLNLGSLYLANKQYKPALRCFQAAAVERSEDPVALLELTGAYFGAGNARAGRGTATA